MKMHHDARRAARLLADVDADIDRQIAEANGELRYRKQACAECAECRDEVGAQRHRVRIDAVKEEIATLTSSIGANWWPSDVVGGCHRCGASCRANTVLRIVAGDTTMCLCPRHAVEMLIQAGAAVAMLPDGDA